MPTIDQVHKEVLIIKEIMTGDGEPEKGLCFRLRILENDVKELIKVNGGGKTKAEEVKDKIILWAMRIAVFGLFGERLVN